jgi:hypothetical protein
MWNVKPFKAVSFSFQVFPFVGRAGTLDLNVFENLLHRIGKYPEFCLLAKQRHANGMLVSARVAERLTKSQFGSFTFPSAQ